VKRYAITVLQEVAAINTYVVEAENPKDAMTQFLEGNGLLTKRRRGEVLQTVDTLEVKEVCTNA